jgi:hypothetical protein
MMQSSRDDVILTQLLRLAEDIKHLRGDMTELRVQLHSNVDQLKDRMLAIETSALAPTIIMGQHALPIATSSSNDDSTANFSTPLAHCAFPPTLNNQDRARSQVSTRSPLSFNDMVSVTKPDLFRAGPTNGDILPESNSHLASTPSPVVEVPSRTQPSASINVNATQNNGSHRDHLDFSINLPISDDILNTHFDEIIKIAQFMLTKRVDFLNSNPSIANIVKGNLCRAQAVKASREASPQPTATAPETQTDTVSISTLVERKPTSRDSVPMRTTLEPKHADSDYPISDATAEVNQAETRTSPQPERPRDTSFRNEGGSSKESTPDTHQLTHSFVSMSIEKVKAPRLKHFNGTALCRFLDAYKEYLSARRDSPNRPTPIRSCVEYDVMAELESMMHGYDPSIPIDWADVTDPDKQFRALAKFTWYRFVVHDLSSMRINPDFKPSDAKQLEVISKQLSSMQTMMRVLHYTGLPSEVYLEGVSSKLPHTLVIAACASRPGHYPCSDPRSTTAYAKVGMCQAYLHHQLRLSNSPQRGREFVPTYPAAPTVHPACIPPYTPPGQDPFLLPWPPPYNMVVPELTGGCWSESAPYSEYY